MKRGHSNVVELERIEKHDESGRAMIAIRGGASVYTCKELPPLALAKDEWVKIGEAMGWIGSPNDDGAYISSELHGNNMRALDASWRYRATRP
jgi:hypothetical protein